MLCKFFIVFAVIDYLLLQKLIGEDFHQKCLHLEHVAEIITNVAISYTGRKSM